MNSRDDRLRQMNSTSEEDFHAFFASSDKRIKFHARARKKYTAKGKGDEYLSFKKGTLLAVLAEDTEAGLYFGRLVIDENCILKTGNASSGEGSDSCNEALATGWFPMGLVVKIKDEEMQRLIRHRQKKKTKEREKEKEKEREKEKEKEREKEREKEKEEKKENEKEKEKVRSMSLPTEPKTPKTATPPSSGRSSSLSSSSKSPRSDDESDRLYSPKSEDSVTPRTKMGSWKRLSGNFIPNKKLKANVDASKKDVDNDSGGAVSSNNPDGGDTKPDTEEASAPEPAKSFLGRGVFGSLRRRGSSTNVLEPSGSEGTGAPAPSPRSPGGNKEEDKRQRRKSLGTLMKLGGSTILSSSSSSTSNLTASTPGSSSSSFSALPSLKSISEREKQATPVAGSKKPAPRVLIKRKSAESGITTKSSDYWASPSANRAEIRRLGSQEDASKKVCISEQDKETTKGSPKLKEREKEMKKKPPPPMKAAHSAPNLEHLIAQMRKKKEAEAEEKKNRQRSNSDGGPIEQEEAVIDQKEVSARKLKQRGKDGEKKKKKESVRGKRKPLLEKEGKRKREKETGSKSRKEELDSSQEKEMEKGMDGDDPKETDSNRLDEDLDVEIIDILRKERAQKRKKKKKKDRKELSGSGGSKKKPVDEEPHQPEDAEEKELPQQQQHQQHSSSLSSSTTTSRDNSKEVDSLQNILEELAGWEEENHLPTGPAYSYYQPEKELAKVPEEVDPSVGDITVEELIQSMKQFPSPPLRDSVLVNTEDVVIEEEFERVRSDSTREPGLTERFVSEDGSGRRSQSGPLVRTKQSVTLPPKSNSAANMPPVDLKAVKLRKIEVAKKDVGVEDPALVELRKKAEDEALRRNKHLEKLSRRAVNKGN